MAEKKEKVEQTPAPQGSDQGKKPGRVLYSVVVVFIALLVVAVVSAGVFYYAVKNNFNGIADILRPQIENHPILSLALPQRPDPDDPKYLTEDQLIKKYNEYRAKVKELSISLEEANNTIEELRKKIESAADAEKILEENKLTLQKIEEEKAKLEAEKKAISEMAARGDKEGFKEYFQQLDKEAAEAIYKEIAAGDVWAEEKKELVKSFSTMEPKNAASVFTELFNQDKETLLDIVEGLKSDDAALILEQMDPKIAAEITKLLSDRNADRYSIK